MADLYTTLVRAKQELNGGRLPVMTPIPESAQHIIDPELTPGLGALEECPERGVRCPVRGCGKYFHGGLTRHLNTIHADAGGAPNVKDLLSIRLTARLTSQRHYRERSERTKRREVAKNLNGVSAKVRSERARKAVKHLSWSKRSRSRRLVGVDNFRNTCEAQTAQRILSIRDRIGRVPSQYEAEHFDPGLPRAALRIYGRWTAAIAACGLKSLLNGRGGRERGREYALEMLAAWYDEHGSLPTEADAKNPRRIPLIPSANTIRKYMGTDAWPDAMRRVAFQLGVHPGRYALGGKSRAA
jgi:hypothetical protein